MLAHHGMADFRCRSTCQHKECQRHSHLGIQDKNETCACLGEAGASSIFLESVLDLANTLAQVMIICGIHECKAKATVDITTYSFLHYDQICYCIDSTPKKRLRKEDLFHELGKRCLMNRIEAHLAYTVIKRGFKAFYYEHKMNTTDPDARNSYSEECVYVHAAKKTAESYARYDGLSCEEQRGIEAKIKVIYKKFYDRMVSRKTQPPGEDCNCCFCAKKRGHLIYGKEPPCSAPKKKPSRKCPYCCQLKKKQMIHQGRSEPKCPVCHRSRKFCTCKKYQFELPCVKSIWERADFQNYYQNEIEEPDFLCCCPSASNSQVDVEDAVVTATTKEAEMVVQPSVHSAKGSMLGSLGKSGSAVEPAGSAMIGGMNAGEGAGEPAAAQPDDA